MAESFELRQILPAGLDQCVAIEHAVFLPSEAATREQIELRIQHYPEGFLVAETSAGIVGFINSGATSKDDLADDALKSLIGHDPLGANVVIFSVAVLPEWQGNGVAKRLIGAIVAQARRRPAAIRRSATVCERAFLQQRAFLTNARSYCSASMI